VRTHSPARTTHYLRCSSAVALLARSALAHGMAALYWHGSIEMAYLKSRRGSALPRRKVANATAISGVTALMAAAAASAASRHRNKRQRRRDIIMAAK